MIPLSVFEAYKAGVEAGRMAPTVMQPGDKSMETLAQEQHHREVQAVVRDGSLQAAQIICIAVRTRAWPPRAGVCVCARSKAKGALHYTIVKVTQPTLSPELLAEIREPVDAKYANAIALAERGEYRTAEGIYLGRDHFAGVSALRQKQAEWQHGWQFLLRLCVGQRLDELVKRGEIIPFELVANEDAPWTRDPWTSEIDTTITTIPPVEMNPAPEDVGEWLIGG